jgi:hypothetical protein
MNESFEGPLRGLQGAVIALTVANVELDWVHGCQFTVTKVTRGANPWGSMKFER